MPRATLLFARLMTPALLGAAVTAAAGGPRISGPRPAPPMTAPLPPLPPAQIDDKLAVGGESVDARKVETRLSVEVRVNGRGPYHFVVDSGADTSVVGFRIARELELPVGSPVVMNGMTDRNIVDRVKVDELSLGPSIVRELELPVLREEDVGGAGMIGIDALVRQRLMMDFAKKLIQVEDASTPARSLDGEIVVTAHLRRGQLILTHVTAAGLPLDAVIDTGSQITIGNLALRDKLVRRNRGKFTTMTGIGVTGKEVEMQVATIAELRLGPVTLTNVPIAFADLPPFKAFGLTERPALFLGTDLLETFRRISLDFKARTVRFQLRRCDSQRVAIWTSPWVAATTRLSSTGTPEVCGR